MLIAASCSLNSLSEMGATTSSAASKTFERRTVDGCELGSCERLISLRTCRRCSSSTVMSPTELPPESVEGEKAGGGCEAICRMVRLSGCVELVPLLLAMPTSEPVAPVDTVASLADVDVLVGEMELVASAGTRVLAELDAPAPAPPAGAGAPAVVPVSDGRA